jgi:hypothetical protein
MDDPVTFLRAELDEDERAARAAADTNEGANWSARSMWRSPFDEHIARHDPARVLAEVDAKRRILDWAVETARVVDQDQYALAPEQVVMLLGLPYAGHLDYRQEWRL